jgi:hypothetical protein
LPINREHQIPQASLALKQQQRLNFYDQLQLTDFTAPPLKQIFYQSGMLRGLLKSDQLCEGLFWHIFEQAI